MAALACLIPIQTTATGPQPGTIRGKGDAGPRFKPEGKDVSVVAQFGAGQGAVPAPFQSLEQDAFSGQSVDRAGGRFTEERQRWWKRGSLS